MFCTNAGRMRVVLGGGADGRLTAVKVSYKLQVLHVISNVKGIRSGDNFHNTLPYFIQWQQKKS